MQKMFDQMMTAAERSDPDNKQKAFNVLKWAEIEEQKKEGGMPDFIRGDFFTPGSSGESTGTLTPWSQHCKNFLNRLNIIDIQIIRDTLGGECHQRTQGRGRGSSKVSHDIF